MSKKSGKQSYPYRAGKPVNRNKSRGWFGSQVENGLKKEAMPASPSHRYTLMLNGIRPQAGSEGYGLGKMTRSINQHFDALERMQALRADPDSGAPPDLNSGFLSGAGVSYRPPY